MYSRDTREGAFDHGQDFQNNGKITRVDLPSELIMSDKEVILKQGNGSLIYFHCK